MEENNNVQQLSAALNQLLDAYENLQKENKELTAKLEDAENKNTELDNKINSLSSATNHQSTEMGDMLNRIETILSNPFGTSSDSEDMPVEPAQQEEESILDQNNEQISNETPQQDDSKAVDLGRMQSLLNGFNN